MRRLQVRRAVAIAIGAAALFTAQPAEAGVPATGNAVALTPGGRLLSFDTAAPGIVLSNVGITGLRAKEHLVGIDVRPVSGQLYGLGTRGGIYVIDTATGAATLRSSLTTVAPDGSVVNVSPAGTAFGIDFNPTVDRLRIVSDANQNLRVNVDTGAIADLDAAAPGTQFDLNLFFAPADVNAGADPFVSGAAYTNNDNNAATATTLYDIDAGLDILAIQAPPNDGTLTTVGPLGTSTSALVGFDVLTGADGSNTAFAALSAPTGKIMATSLYTIDLATGTSTLIGPIGNRVSVLDMATLQPAI